MVNKVLLGVIILVVSVMVLMFIKNSRDSKERESKTLNPDELEPIEQYDGEIGLYYNLDDPEEIYQKKHTGLEFERIQNYLPN